MAKCIKGWLRTSYSDRLNELATNATYSGSHGRVKLVKLMCKILQELGLTKSFHPDAVSRDKLCSVLDDPLQLISQLVHDAACSVSSSLLLDLLLDPRPADVMSKILQRLKPTAALKRVATAWLALDYPFRDDEPQRNYLAYWRMLGLGVPEEVASCDNAAVDVTPAISLMMTMGTEYQLAALALYIIHSPDLGVIPGDGVVEKLVRLPMDILTSIVKSGFTSGVSQIQAIVDLYQNGGKSKCFGIMVNLFTLMSNQADGYLMDLPDMQGNKLVFNMVVSRPDYGASRYYVAAYVYHTLMLARAVLSRVYSKSDELISNFIKATDAAARIRSWQTKCRKSQPK